mmetsp:Transcript_32847/g.37371  ORF Transcript_32847/g.37371 Transcript_32847/m.37371 type:complete len:127 (-) Transcript_32847:1099-1479(-)
MKACCRKQNKLYHSMSSRSVSTHTVVTCRAKDEILEFLPESTGYNPIFSFVTNYKIHPENPFFNKTHVLSSMALCKKSILAKESAEKQQVVSIFVSSYASSRSSKNATHAMAPPAKPNPTGRITIK